MYELKLVPSIDLLGGACVRLHQGQFASATRYAQDPLAVAKRFEAAGAEYLHVVDLDGAKARLPLQASIVSAIVKETGLKVQIGGGIRSLSQAMAYIQAGADRVVIGSLAVTAPDSAVQLIEYLGPNAVTLAFDFWTDDQGKLHPAVNAWTRLEDISLGKLFEAFTDFEGLHYLCTDINRDGALAGINAGFYRQLLRYCPASSLYASGGVQGLDDLKTAKDLRLAGLIIGKALYEKRFTLEEALSC